MSDKIQLPQSGGGLIRYFDEYKSKIELSPKVVVVMIVIIVALMAILHKARPLG